MSNQVFDQSVLSTHLCYSIVATCLQGILLKYTHDSLEWAVLEEECIFQSYPEYLYYNYTPLNETVLDSY